MVSVVPLSSFASSGVAVFDHRNIPIANSASTAITSRRIPIFVYSGSFKTPPKVDLKQIHRIDFKLSLTLPPAWASTIAFRNGWLRIGFVGEAGLQLRVAVGQVRHIDKQQFTILNHHILGFFVFYVLIIQHLQLHKRSKLYVSQERSQYFYIIHNLFTFYCLLLFPVVT